METIVIKIDTKSNAAMIKEALKLFKGVKKISDELSATDIEELENISMLKAVKLGRKTPKVAESEIFKALK